MGEEPITWSMETGTVGLGNLPGGAYDGQAFAVSSDGTFVGGSSQTAGPDKNYAFIWDAENGMRNVSDLLLSAGVFDVAGWELHNVKGVSSDGLIVAGNGRDPAGNLVGWIARLPILAELLGDMDYDGDKDFDDIDDFVLGLNFPAAYEGLYGLPPSARGDTDQDGDVDFDDIAGFVAILNAGLVSGGTQNVPEPATAILAAIGLLGLVACGYRQRGAA
ncbi:MAG: PEP-CTERM sorting domain-containing protein [Pirellulales bacterium]